MDEAVLSFDDMSVWMESCALTGAAAFFAGLRGCAVIVNGPLWCYLFTQRHIEQSQSDISHRMKCTQLDNDAIVFGAEEYLREALQPHIDHPPALLAVISGSSASLIGDDVGAIARAAGVTCPVVTIDSGGLVGSFADGWTRASCAMLDVLLRETRGEVRRGVNLIGMTSSYYNGENDVRELVRLLTGAGYEVRHVFGCDMAPESIGDLSQAELNIVVHDELGLAAAKHIEQHCGTPYIAPLPPYGRAGTRRWLAAVFAALPPVRGEDAMAEIAAAERRDFLRINDLKNTWGELLFDTALIRAPRSSAWGLAEALRTEWADVRHLAVAAQLREDAAAVKIADEQLAETDTARAQELLAAMERGLLMGSSSESVLADPCRMLYVPVAYPVVDRLHISDQPFMGLRGARHIEDTLWNGSVLRRELSVRAGLHG